MSLTQKPTSRTTSKSAVVGGRNTENNSVFLLPTRQAFFPRNGRLGCSAEPTSFPSVFAMARELYSRSDICAALRIDPATCHEETGVVRLAALALTKDPEEREQTKDFFLERLGIDFIDGEQTYSARKAKEDEGKAPETAKVECPSIGEPKAVPSPSPKAKAKPKRRKKKAAVGKRPAPSKNEDGPDCWDEMFSPEGLESGQITFLVPKGFPEIIGSGKRPARIAYVINLVSSYCSSRKGGRRIHSKTIERIISKDAWAKAKDFLSDYWDVTDYISGKRSKAYRWKKKWMDAGFETRTYEAPIFAARLEKFRLEDTDDDCPIKEKLWDELKRVETTIEDPAGFVRELPDKAETKDPHARKMSAADSLLAIRTKRIKRPTRDQSGRRMHHFITRTPKEVRKTFLVDRERLVEWDLSNSQPIFLEGIAPEIERLGEIAGAGQFYEEANKRLEEPYDFEIKGERDSFKELAMEALFRKRINGREYWKDEGSKMGAVLQAMESAFPGIYEFTRAYAEANGEKALSNRLLSEESSVFIDSILPTLQQMGVFAVPIHDCILCKESDSELVRETMERLLEEKTGIRPCLKKK